MNCIDVNIKTWFDDDVNNVIVDVESLNNYYWYLIQAMNGITLYDANVILDSTRKVANYTFYQGIEDSSAQIMVQVRYQIVLLTGTAHCGCWS